MWRDIRRRDIDCGRFPICCCRKSCGRWLRGTIFGEHLHHFYKIGSTNTAAMAAAAEGAPEGSVFLAEEQTAGRGRGANTWQSPRSTGIYCSVVLRPALPPSDVLVLSLAAGLAVRSAIQQVDSRVSADLKWPNDVLIDGKKVCGILTEMNAEATRVRYIVVGIGINVNQAEFSEGVAGDFATIGERKRVVAGGVGGCFAKIARSRVSAAIGKFRCAGVDSAAICREFVLGARARQCASKRMATALRARRKAWMRAAFCRCEREGDYAQC